jgi:Zn-dependent peptidase ImmA (M78 family)
VKLSAYRALARLALRGALTVRARCRIARERALCVFDAAEQLGVEVRFAAINSLGGMYERQSNVILLPSERPRGRQAFTCAHELGHWYFGHGTRLDRLLEIDEAGASEPEELLASMFAGYLLMPARAVETAFARRQWNPSSATPFDIYVVATQLGVGYETLVRHLQLSLDLIPDERARELLKTNPRAIRASLLDDTPAGSLLIVADSAWGDVPIDLQVGDVAIVPKGARVEGKNVRPFTSTRCGEAFEAYAPGISRVESDDAAWASFIRVARKHYSGRSVFRHLADPDDFSP